MWFLHTCLYIFTKSTGLMDFLYSPFGHSLLWGRSSSIGKDQVRRGCWVEEIVQEVSVDCRKMHCGGFLHLHGFHGSVLKLQASFELHAYFQNLCLNCKCQTIKPGTRFDEAHVVPRRCSCNYCVVKTYKRCHCQERNGGGRWQGS